MGTVYNIQHGLYNIQHITMDTVYNIQHGLTLQWTLYTTSSMGSHYNGHCIQHPAWVYMGTIKHPAWVDITMDTVYNIQHGFTLQWALHTTSSIGSHYNGHCIQHPAWIDITMDTVYNAWVHITMDTAYNIQHGFTLQ